MLIAQHIIGKVSVLSNAQRRFFILAVQAILCCRWRINFASMSRVSSRTEKTFRRHFTKSIDFPRIHREVIDTVLPKDGEGLRVIGFDPTFIPKSGTHTPGVSKFWNGSGQRAESGLEATVAAVIDVGRRIALPLAIHQTLRPAVSQAVDSDIQSEGGKEATSATMQTIARQTTVKKADTTKDERRLIEEY
ncbi:MAG: transposase, partial [Gloeotrichia echinulata HAB0833]